MATLGIGDPYWYEWYVGLGHVIKMLNPDSGISCVIFQHNDYNTIDDVVVEYTDGNRQLCYQVKHQIETSSPNNLTFGKMLTATEDDKKCLFEAMFDGWKDAKKAGISISPVLFTNRKVTGRKSGRHFNGKPYSAYAVDDFIAKMQEVLEKSPDPSNITISDASLLCQWNELCSAIPSANTDEFFAFISAFSIEANQPGLNDLKQSLIAELAQSFSCSEGVALELFGRLLIGLTEWTTAGRKSQKVTIEDVYSVLSIEEMPDDSQHRLAPPFPFFESRQVFCGDLERQIRDSKEKVVFLSGDPGSGKTSIVSYLQAETNLFLLRFHTFKPISPEQHFYNADPGMCTAENLWGTLLIQLRQKFRGRIAEFNVPVSNKLLTVEGMRSHVMRLLGILAQDHSSRQDRIFVCIDGIDHAARANADMSFLKTLPASSEIPDGVCFVIVGQPIELYRDQYPIWLTTYTGVEKIEVPKLKCDDIKQLLLAHGKQFADAVDGLADLIFQKTEGNNLSVVYAIEEIKSIDTLEKAVVALNESNIGTDIQQYYAHIWDHMRTELSRIAPAIVFPESVVACPLLLMNGRVNTGILASAISNGLRETAWRQILNRLYPLVVRIECDGEYAFFHNDFRVFLMGVIAPYREAYEETARQLAEYLLQNDSGTNKYVLGIPLLQSAKREDLIPQYFDTEFVIGALSEGISKQRLDEYAHLSYQAACNAQNLDGYLNTYVAIKTLYQHNRYFEYYDKKYLNKDHPELNSIDISEIRVLPIANETIDEYRRVLALCVRLYNSTNHDHQQRAQTLYEKWFGRCSPCSFLDLCNDTVSEESAWELKSTEVGFFLQHWGTAAANLGAHVPAVTDLNSKLKEYAVVIFGEQYFISCIADEKYDLSLQAIDAGYVDARCFAEKLESIYYAGKAGLFNQYLKRLPRFEDEPEFYLLAHSMKITFEPSYSPEPAVFDSTPKVTRIYDKSSFNLILNAFLIGRAKKEFSDTELLDTVDELCLEISEKKHEKDEAVFFARTAILLGKYYWFDGTVPDTFAGYVYWLFTASVRRPFDYSKAHVFLLYTLLKSKTCESLCNDSDFIASLCYALFNMGLLGMYYKTYILDFLVKHNRLDIVDEYIRELYGENCSKISLEENKADMHNRFIQYGVLVEPDLMQEFSNMLKWDVVGYMGYKEYAMYAPLEFFNTIVAHSPERWEDLGAQLYQQSCLADISCNDTAYEIENSIEKAAVSCGLNAYCKLRNWSDTFKLNPNRIYQMLFTAISRAESVDELKALWILNCGIHSWYTLDERSGAKCIYDACAKKAEDLNCGFSEIVAHITPQWWKIIEHLNAAQGYEHEAEVSEYAKKQAEEIAALQITYEELSVDDALNIFSLVPSKNHFVEQFRIIAQKVLSYHPVSKCALLSLLEIACVHLCTKEWSHSEYDSVIRVLLSELGDEAFWKIATSIEAHLSDYEYQTASRNIQVLLKLGCCTKPEVIERVFTKELEAQKLWVSGNEHLHITAVVDVSTCVSTEYPDTLPKLVLAILLEQLELQNARKTETAVYALYLLGVQFPDIKDAVAKQWSELSNNQESWLLIVVARWVMNGLCTESLQTILQDLYANCTELEKKYYLHSILLHLDPENCGSISYEALGREYVLQKHGLTIRKSFYENFLSLIDEYGYGGLADAVRRHILQVETIENYIHDPYGVTGDSKIPVIDLQIGELLYSIEQAGYLDGIPLLDKKSRLLPPEDPFIMTELPTMTFDHEWFPEVVVRDNSDGVGLSCEQLQEIAHHNIENGEVVLAACLWYPWGHSDGAIYIESSMLSEDKAEKETSIFDWCLGNYGLLSHEGALCETTNAPQFMDGFSLFNRVGGMQKIIYGNCQLAPSSIWRQMFNCRPDPNNPLILLNNEDVIVLRFERIAAPFREGLQETYIRQPILFRWICNKSWLDTTLSNSSICLSRIFQEEKYPNLSE